MANIITQDASETVNLTFTIGRDHAEWLARAGGTFGVPASMLVSLAIMFLERYLKI